MSFSEVLRADATDVWQAMHDHPFVRGIGDGTLDAERFRFYIRQDYLFLIDYGRLLALACARAPRLELMERFAGLAQSILGTEMDLHRAYAAEWGISREELEQQEAHPTTRAYTDFLLRTATLGDFGELIAALLPCMWGYSEVAQRLEQEQTSTANAYAPWVEMYAGEEFSGLARWCREVCDEAGAEGATTTRARMRDAFLRSSRHELAFWESAWQSVPPSENVAAA